MIPLGRPLLATIVALSVALTGCDESDTSTAPTRTSDTSAETTGTTDSLPDQGLSVELMPRLPAMDAIPSLRSGDAREVFTARAMVEALYQDTDPQRDAAVTRLEEAGYTGGVLRDQQGANPRRGLALLRSYIYRLRDDDAAQQEVDATIDELKGIRLLKTTDVPVPDVPGARGLYATTGQRADQGEILFITWPEGPDVHALQLFTYRGSKLFRNEAVELARTLYAAHQEG